jgi:hypothetical protein
MKLQDDMFQETFAAVYAAKLDADANLTPLKAARDVVQELWLTLSDSDRMDLAAAGMLQTMAARLQSVAPPEGAPQRPQGVGQMSATVQGTRAERRAAISASPNRDIRYREATPSASLARRI